MEASAKLEVYNDRFGKKLVIAATNRKCEDILDVD